jgi:hypothetical protein
MVRQGSGATRRNASRQNKNQLLWELNLNIRHRILLVINPGSIQGALAGYSIGFAVLGRMRRLQQVKVSSGLTDVPVATG